MNIFLGFENACPKEVQNSVKLAVEGEVPSTLRGTLYRNGPGQYAIFGERYNHLFDGDGLATRIAFQDDGVYYTSRYVRTKHLLAEERKGRRIYGTYATRPVGGPISRFINRDFKNVSNTNLVYHWETAFSLYEGGPPYRLDPVTLETIGEELFDGKLADQQKFSAHPHRDPDTGDLWNFGLTRKKETVITVYNMRGSGEFEVPYRIVSPYSGIVHDFGFTPNYLIFVIPPVRLPKIPLGVALGQRSFFESLRWHPEEDTCIIIVDRRTGSETRHFVKAFMNFHFANAYEEDGRIIVDLCNFDNFDVMRSMSELIAGRRPPKSVSHLERLVVAGDRVSRDRLTDVSMEFPRVVAESWGRKCRYCYGTSWAERDWISVPMRHDLETGTTELVSLAAHQFGGEPVPVPKTRGQVDDVWLLFTVLDTEKNRNEVYIVDGNHVTAPPLAKLILPQRIPFPLHGNWVPFAG